MSPRRLPKAGLFALTGAATALGGCAAPGRFNGDMWGDGSLFVGASFGGEKVRVRWGLDGRVGTGGPSLSPCGGWNEVVGGFGRLAFEGWTPELSIGVQGGYLNAPMFAFMGEGGVGWRFGEGGGFILPLDLRADPSLGSMRLGFEPVRESFWFTVGGAVSNLDGGCAVAGRPRRAEAGHAPLPAAALAKDASALGTLDPERRAAAIDTWADRARTEYASVATFLELAGHLVDAGAPEALVARAYRAAAEELEHAARAGRLAAGWAGGHLRLTPETDPFRPALPVSAARIRLAVESWVDGCLGEGFAARCAAEERAATSIPLVDETLAHVVTDESRHAELAWDIVAWAIQTGGDEVRHALWAVREAVPAVDTKSADVDLTDVGVLAGPVLGAVQEHVVESARRRLARLLG